MDLLPQALCSIQDIKDYLQSDPQHGLSNQHNDIFTLMINGFTKMAESSILCNRSFEKKHRIEYFNAPRDYLIVSAPPIDLSQPIKVYDGGYDRQFDDFSRLITHEDYYIEPNEGIIKPLYTSFCDSGSQSLKLEYVGGLVVPTITDGVPTGPAIGPEDLRMACVMQIVAWFRNKNFFGIDRVQLPAGAGMSVMDPTKLLPAVKMILMTYRRFNA